MTPNEIEILIHYHVCPDPHPRIDAPAVQEATDDFIKEDLITPLLGDAGGYVTTERGDAHIFQLCNVKYPVNRWCDQYGDKIIP